MLVDRISCRRILLCTLWALALFLTLAAIYFHWIPIRQYLSLINQKAGWSADVVLMRDILHGFLLFRYGQYRLGYHPNII